MRAAITTGPGQVEVAETDPTDRRPGEAIVRVQLSMLTSTDAAWFDAPPADRLPMVQGGAAAGTLETGIGALADSNVVVWPWINCRRCPSCLATSNEVCESRTRLGIDRPGTLSERTIVPRGNVVAVPPSVGPAEALAAVGYADAWRLVTDAGNLGRRSRVLVAGTGQLADQVSAFAKLKYANVVRVENLAGLTFTHIIAIDTPIEGLLPLLKPSGSLVARALDSSTAQVDLRQLSAAHLTIKGRSEERRVGKECRSRWSPDH